MCHKMKTKNRFIIRMIVLIICIILIIPIPTQWRDGTKEYKSLTYSIIHYCRSYEIPQREGWKVTILGIIVYNDWKEI